MELESQLEELNKIVSLKKLFEAYQKCYTSNGKLVCSGYGIADENYFTKNTDYQYKTIFTAVKPVKVFYFSWDLSYYKNGYDNISGYVSGLYTTTFDVGQTKSVGSNNLSTSYVYYSGACAYLLEEL